MKLYNSGFFVAFITLFIFSSCKKEPVASFDFDKNNVKAPVTVNFTNTSTNATEYLWNFGDGVTTTEANPSHEYVKGGDFDITLKAYGEDETNSTIKTITILPTMTGHWTINFALFGYHYTGRLNLIEFENQTLGGEFAFGDAPDYNPIQNSSKIDGSAVTIGVMLYGTALTFQGTVNSNYDSMSGDFYFNGNLSGTWSAVKN